MTGRATARFAGAAAFFAAAGLALVAGFALAFAAAFAVSLDLSAFAEETRSELVGFARAGVAVSRSAFFGVVVFFSGIRPSSP